MPIWGWRAVFFVGVLPALLTVWVQRRVEEPALWRNRQAAPAARRGRLGDVFRGGLGRLTIAVTLMNACTMFAWWGFNQWIPAYLSLPAADGGIGLSTRMMSGFIIAMQVGMWFGYVTFRVHQRRRRAQARLCDLPADGGRADAGLRSHAEPTALLLLGPVVAFFATGYFTGFGAVTAEIYPTEIRATAQGFTYNIGRIGSAIAPWAVGRLADTSGFGAAFSLSAVALRAARPSCGAGFPKPGAAPSRSSRPWEVGAVPRQMPSRGTVPAGCPRSRSVRTEVDEVERRGAVQDEDAGEEQTGEQRLDGHDPQHRRRSSRTMRRHEVTPADSAHDSESTAESNRGAPGRTGRRRPAVRARLTRTGTCRR